MNSGVAERDARRAGAKRVSVSPCVAPFSRARGPSISVSYARASHCGVACNRWIRRTPLPTIGDASAKDYTVLQNVHWRWTSGQALASAAAGLDTLCGERDPQRLDHSPVVAPPP